VYTPDIATMLILQGALSSLFGLAMIGFWLRYRKTVQIFPYFAIAVTLLGLILFLRMFIHPRPVGFELFLNGLIIISFALFVWGGRASIGKRPIFWVDILLALLFSCGMIYSILVSHSTNMLAMHMIAGTAQFLIRSGYNLIRQRDPDLRASHLLAGVPILLLGLALAVFSLTMYRGPNIHMDFVQTGDLYGTQILILVFFFNIVQLSILNMFSDTMRKHLEETNAAQQRATKAYMTLLRESNHRIKNNLNLVSSVLSLQESIAEGETRSVLRESRNRVMAVSHLHDFFSSMQDLLQLSTEDFLRSLLDRIGEGLPPGRTLSFNQVDGSPEWDIDTLMPISLILNEVITNAAKHAYPAGESGEVDVSLSEDPAGGGHLLSVVDFGAGLKPGLDPYESDSSLGGRIVKLLAGQLNARVALESTPGQGTRVDIHFPPLSH